MLNVSLIKHGKRATRSITCKRCKVQLNQTYWMDTVDSTDGRVHHVLVTRDDLPANSAARSGDTDGQIVSIPVAAVHKCDRKYLIVDGQPLPDEAPVPAPAPDEAPVPAPVPAPEDVPAPAPAPVPAPDSDVAALLAQLAAVLARPAVDEATVREICAEIVKGMVFPVQTVIIRDGVRHEVPGLTHRSLSRVISAVSVGEDVMLVGPAGTGKSHMARQVATATGVDFYTPSSSLTAQTGESKFTGYMDANGKFHGTEVYSWATNPNGGIFCLDEIDNGNPNITGWWNAVLANRFITFPNGETVQLTDKHRVIGTANTYGFGRTREFVGRNPMDGATRNRFTFITIKIDEALETALVHGTGVKADTAAKVLAYVQSIRVAADREGIDVMCSPRNSVRMARLLTTDDYDWDMAVEDGLRAGIPDETWVKLTAAMRAA